MSETLKTRKIKSGFIIQVPEKIGQTLGLNNADTKLFCIQVGETLQLSAKEPKVTIPAIALDPEEFQIQPA